MTADELGRLLSKHAHELVHALEADGLTSPMGVTVELMTWRIREDGTREPIVSMVRVTNSPRPVSPPAEEGG